VIARVVAFSARHSTSVLLAALAAAGAGELGRRALARDVLPDLADPQIVLVADWMGHPAPEVAAAVGDPLTRALDGIPGATAVRAQSMAGMAYLDVVLAPAADLAGARRAILARVAAVRAQLPAAVRVDVGPPTSSTSWVFQYALTDPSHGQPPLALRRLQDEQLRPALASIPGVAEVASVGGAVEELLVETQSARLAAAGAAFSDVVAALRPALAARPEMGATAIAALPLEAAALAGRPPPRIGDVARVRPITDAMPSGIADLDGLLPAVGGVVIADRRADLGRLIPRVRQVLAAQGARLPAGVQLVNTYDRLALAARVDSALGLALAEEVGVVALVILLFLLDARSALVPLLTLPVVVLLTCAGMWLLGIPATIMSLGGIGIALGLAVDADIVALEACHRKIENDTATPAHAGAGRRAALVAAAGSFAPAILTSLLIATITFLPVLGFSGETGRLLRPLALSKTLVIAAAALVSITLAPALRDRLLRGTVRAELANPLTRLLIGIYRPFVHFALARPTLTLASAALAVISCLPLLPRLGVEFLPRIDEGDLLFMPTTRAGVAPHQAAAELRRLDRAAAVLPEVARVFGKVGRADTATDPAPFSMAETTIALRPRATWPARARRRWFSDWAPAPLRAALGLVWAEETPATTAELIADLDRATRLPGWTGAWTAPVRARIDMLATGVRTPVGIRIVATDPARLETLAAGVRALVSGVAGTRSATLESLGGEERLTLIPDAAAAGLFQVNPTLARATADLVVAGGVLGDLRRDGRRVRLRVTPEVAVRGPADQLRELTVRGTRGAGSQPVPLGLIGRPQIVREPAALRSERGERVALVHVDLSETTNPGSYVEAAQRTIDDARSRGALVLRSGERLEWTGQYPIILAGQRRLRWIVPAVLLSMLLLLVLLFRNLTEALIVLASVPLALVGSVWTLFLAGFALSAPVWVGLLSAVGLAMQTAVVMVVYIDAAFHARARAGRINGRDDIVAAHAEGTIQRLRPKVMTITTMAAGLLPLVWAQGAGSEVMRRVAAPMLGGLATSAFLTLEVLPVLYTIWRHRQLRRAQRRGVPLAEVLGRIPPWARS
jgi:copper/silver efflux system protein